MKEYISITKNEPTYDLHVMWAIHTKCNYSCSYCPDNLHNGSYAFLNLDYMKGFIDKINSHYVENLGFKNILFSFTGGEPTLWPDFQKFLHHINHYGFRVGLTSNGSVSVKYWERISSYFDYICLSFHPESADIDHFLKVYEYLHNDPKTVIPSVRVMMHKDQKFWDKSEALIRRLKEFPNWTYECVHILEDYGIESSKIDYASKEKINFLKENAFRFQFDNQDVIRIPSVDFNYKIESTNHNISKLDENALINNDSANFKDWVCYIGIEQLFINSLGDIYRAGCQVGGKLGTIYNYEAVDFPYKPITCTKAHCHCPTDIRITKFHPDQGMTLTLPMPQFIPRRVGNPLDTVFKFKFILEMSAIKDNDSLANFINLIKDKIHVLNARPQEILIHASINQNEKLESEYLSKIVDNLPSISLGLELSTDESFSYEFIQQFFPPAIYVRMKYRSFSFKTAVQMIGNIHHFSLGRGILVYDYIEHPMFIINLIKLFSFIEKNYHLAEIRVNNFPEKLLQQFNRFKALQDKLLFINNTLYFYNILPKSFDKQSYRRACFVGDNALFSENLNSTMLSYTSDELASRFKNWNCKMASQVLYIESDGSIKTSQCSQSILIGNLQSKIEITDEVYNTKCIQESCASQLDRTIPKHIN